MDIANIPFTLVVRAPNQRVADQVVEVKPQWTVKELKQHLSNVYPSQPGELQQKLIYSGKLMQDDKLLTEILTQHTQKQAEIEDKLQYIVHLVCSPSVEPYKSDSKESVSSSSSSVSDIHSSTEGLRHRTHVSTSPVVTETNFVPSNPGPAQPALHHNPVMAAPPMGPEMMAYSPEQYMLMMQNYYHQMATHYMQYYQTGALPVHPTQMVHPNTQTVTPAHAAEQPANQNQPNAPRDGAAANENMVMNAQGGMVEDDDDEFGHRDWLDYLYTFSRFMILVTIVYFYSNFTRFLMVFAFFVVVYLYQTGWFVFRRREHTEPQQQQQQEEQQTEEHQVQQEPQNNTENVQDDNNSEESVESSQQPTQQQAEEPPKPSAIGTLWCFVSTFFTSLIPQQPEPVNLN